MAQPRVNYEIVMIGSAASIRARVAGNFLVRVYKQHVDALKAGTYADPVMQSEFRRLGGPGLLCRLIEARS